MKVLIDTNVLVRMVHFNNPHQPIADAALSNLRDGNHELRTVPQVLYEFWAVASRPISSNGLELPVSALHTLLGQWRELFPPLRDERGILDIWKQLAFDHNVIGKQSHDARLVAAMQRHGLTHILTFNAKDFKRYSEVTVLDAVVVAS